jgi:hypothetical protein
VSDTTEAAAVPGVELAVVTRPPHDRDKVPFSQLKLCSGVFGLIDDLGVGGIGQETINAVARACDDLMAALLADPDVRAKTDAELESEGEIE